MTLTTDLSEKPIADYYAGTNEINLDNLSWIGYGQIDKLLSGHNLT